ncbi:MAG: ABC transporter ATP-binding protein [Pseudonocardiaceae bacterium]
MRNLTQRLLAMAPGARWPLAGLVVIGLLITVTYVAQGILIARVLAAVFAGGAGGSILGQLVGVALLQAARAWLLATREARAPDVSGTVKAAVREHLTAKLFELGPGALQRTRSGSMQSTAVDSVEQLDPLVGRFLPQIAASIIGAVGVTAYVIVLDPLVGVIILVCALAAPVAAVVGSRLMKRRADAWTAAYRGLYAENLDAVQGMATLKAFNASRRRGAELHARAEAFCRDSIRVMVAWCLSAGVAELAIPIGTAAAIGIGALHRAGGVITTVELFTILLLSRECFRPLHDLQNVYHQSYNSLPSSRSIFALLDTEPEVGQPAEPVPVASLAYPPGLRFEGISFGYAERSERALDGFSLSVAPGERVALVGRSGAGKTTIVSLLLRFFEFEQGRILIGERDTRELALAELRGLVGVVAQDTYLFHGSVRDNLLLGRADASVEQLEAAARAARAHEFICALPDGYDTVIGERGLKLSGGERQRIAIARALLKDAPILVLDEPTSSVDAANEAEIQRALDELTRGRTTLVIAHRLSTVRDADRIVVLDHGRVLEAGAHHSLLQRQGAYAELVAAQAGGGAR